MCLCVCAYMFVCLYGVTLAQYYVCSLCMYVCVCVCVCVHMVVSISHAVIVLSCYCFFPSCLVDLCCFNSVKKQSGSLINLLLF